MTTTFQADCHIPYSIQVWALIAILPALFAAGVLEKPSTTIEIPEEGSYRSPLSENLLESNNWRIPQEEKQEWRLPPPAPSLDWRAPQATESETSSSRRTIELFPRYKSGKPSDYDMIEHEERPLIKMFEFGSK